MVPDTAPLDTAPSDTAPPDTAPPDTVVFDIGNVLLAWDPAMAFAGVLDPTELEEFMAEVDFAAWNHAQDAGRTWADGLADLEMRHPHRAQDARLYVERYRETVTGEVEGTAEVVAELAAAGTRLLALTNWSAETFPWARATFDVLARFEGIVVSGDERLAKPDPALFALLVERYALDPTSTVFVDDSPVNVAAAEVAGLGALRFVDAPTLRRDLRALGLPVAATSD